MEAEDLCSGQKIHGAKLITKFNLHYYTNLMQCVDQGHYKKFPQCNNSNLYN